MGDTKELIVQDEPQKTEPQKDPVKVNPVVKKYLSHISPGMTAIGGRKYIQTQAPAPSSHPTAHTQQSLPTETQEPTTPPTKETAIPPTAELTDKATKEKSSKERKYLNIEKPSLDASGKPKTEIGRREPSRQSKPPLPSPVPQKLAESTTAKADAQQKGETKPSSPIPGGFKTPSPALPGSKTPTPAPATLDHAKMRKLAEEANYQLGVMIAKGAESVLYIGDFGGQELCVKAIRNKLNRWIGDSITKGQEERLENVPYHTKKRHILNEYNTARALYSDSELPIVHIYALRKVSAFGLEVGYDLIMEALHGHDLSDRTIARTLGFEDKLNVMVQAVKALEYVHRHKFIHLDIKPSNYILVNNHVKLIDFGVTVMNGYRPTAVTGTGGFLSPEQICKETLDEASDIFALGVTLAVFFGGKSLNQPQDSLLKSKTRQEAKYKLEHEDQPQVIDIPDLAPYPELAQILRNCTIPRRDLRTKSCSALLSHLRHWATEHPQAAEGMFDE